MQCPNCKKGKLIENLSYVGVFKRYKLYSYFCPLCNYEKEKKIPYSLSDSLIEVGKDLEKIGKRMEG